RLASAAGSPAVRSPSKFTPLTTQPLRTSRQAMSRFESISASRHPNEVAQNAKPGFAGFFRMELHTEDVVGFNCRSEHSAVLTCSGRFAVCGRGIRMREVHLCVF